MKWSSWILKEIKFLGWLFKYAIMGDDDTPEVTEKQARAWAARRSRERQERKQLSAIGKRLRDMDIHHCEHYYVKFYHDHVVIRGIFYVRISFHDPKVFVKYGEAIGNSMILSAMRKLLTGKGWASSCDGGWYECKNFRVSLKSDHIALLDYTGPCSRRKLKARYEFKLNDPDLFVKIEGLIKEGL